MRKLIADIVEPLADALGWVVLFFFDAFSNWFVRKLDYVEIEIEFDHSDEAPQKLLRQVEGALRKGRSGTSEEDNLFAIKGFQPARPPWLIGLLFFFGEWGTMIEVLGSQYLIQRVGRRQDFELQIRRHLGSNNLALLAKVPRLDDLTPFVSANDVNHSELQPWAIVRGAHGELRGTPGAERVNYFVRSVIAPKWRNIVFQAIRDTDVYQPENPVEMERLLRWFSSTLHEAVAQRNE